MSEGMYPFRNSPNGGDESGGFPLVRGYMLSWTAYKSDSEPKKTSLAREEY